MKKHIGFFLMFALVTIMACNDKPAEVKKEVIIVPTAPVVVVKEVPEKTTSITVDKNGVKVQAKKVNVVIKKQ